MYDIQLYSPSQYSSLISSPQAILSNDDVPLSIAKAPRNLDKAPRDTSGLKRSFPPRPERKKPERDQLLRQMHSRMRSKRHKGRPDWWTSTRLGKNRETYRYLPHRVSRPRAQRRLRYLEETKQQRKVAPVGLTNQQARKAVADGLYNQTRGGLTREKMVFNKRGKYVSRSRYKRAKSQFDSNVTMQVWSQALRAVAEQYREQNKRFSLRDKATLDEVRRTAENYEKQRTTDQDEQDRSIEEEMRQEEEAMNYLN